MFLSLQLERRWIIREPFTWWSLLIKSTRQPEESLALARRIPESAVIKAVVTELKDCIATNDLDNARALHSQAIHCGWDRNKYVANTLITMYSKLGSIHEARKTFTSMTNRDVVSWTALIVGYAENGDHPQALKLFESMDCEPNGITFTCLLKVYAGLATEGKLDKTVCLQRGLDIHRRTTELGLDKGLVVASTLVDLYSKCGDVSLAREVFDRMKHRDVVTWTALIMGYVENGRSSEALELFANLDCAPNSVTLIAAAKACGALASSGAWEREKCLEKGVSIHGEAKALGCDRDVALATTLVDMYSKFHEVALARQTFDEISKKTPTSWTALILGYVDCGNFGTALEMFDRMDCPPDKVTVVAVLKACAEIVKYSDRKSCLCRVQSVHKEAIDHGFDKELAVANALVDLYGKCGDMTLAREVFDRMKERNVISWTVLILGYAENGESSIALNMFESMDCAPNSVTFVGALKACASSDKERSVSVHKRARELGFDADISVANTLVGMYSRCREMASARDVFDGMQERTVVSWNVLILGYVENEQYSEALEMYTRMNIPPNRVTVMGALKACACTGALEIGQGIHKQIRELGMEKDGMIASCLVDFYGKCGDASTAEQVFRGIESPDVVCWNARVGVYSHRGDVSRVFSLVEDMAESHVQMNNVTVLLMLTACSHAGMVDEGQRLLEWMQKHDHLRPGVEHYNCLVDMLARANKVDEAIAAIKKMPLQGNAVTWKTLLGACRQWNNVEAGKAAFDTLKVCDESSAVGYVLMADIYGIDSITR